MNLILKLDGPLSIARLTHKRRFARLQPRLNGKTLATATLVFLVNTHAAHALPIDVPNASFESPSTPATSSTNFDLIPGWVFNVTGGIEFGTKAISSNFTSPGASSGNNYVFLDNDAPGAKETITSAASLGTITPLTTYTLSVAVGNDEASDSVIFGEPGNVTFSLLANGVAFATQEVINGTVPNGTFDDFTLTYTTPATGSIIGENLTIELASLPQTGWGYEAAFDNVTLDAVPEPQAAALMVVGALALGWLMRRKLVPA